MRQAGVLAACGLVALEEEVPRLAGDHENAALLADGPRGIDALAVSPWSARTNMVFVTPGPEDHEPLRASLGSNGILTGSQKPTMRLVPHRDVTRADVEKVVDAFHAFYRRR